MSRRRRKGKNRGIILLVLSIFIIGTFAYGLTMLILPQSPSEPKSTASTPSGQPSAGEEFAVIETKFGKMTIRFFPQVAPRHVDNFKKLARQGFYDGTTFHRVIPRFMIQGGDPNTKDNDRTNDGIGGPGYTIPAEFNSVSHKRGIVSMARAQDPNSAGSQFFIVVQDSTFLDRQYTVFGEVVNGIEAADKIVSQPRDARDNPLEKIEMKVRITTNP